MVPVRLAVVGREHPVMGNSSRERERERETESGLAGRPPPSEGADMALKTKVSGTWKHVRASVNVAGAWREVPQMYVRVGGGWKPLYTFSWEAGAWSSCSASCGGGTQTRDVKCRRSDGQYFSDAVGARFAGEKPAAGQPCNTQACSECYYEYGLESATFWTVVDFRCDAKVKATQVYWKNSLVYDGTFDELLTSVTVGGYVYSRSELKLTDYEDAFCFWDITYYEVCRSPA